MMLASVHHFNSKDNYVKVKMEEQTVPSAGFSPQPDPYDSGYMTTATTARYMGQGYGNVAPTTIEDPATYNNLADTFDLSLLGDNYDDHDMATVPSPSSWSSAANYEPTTWQQMSLYAASPSGDQRAFSPDCKPALSPVHPFASNSNDSYQAAGTLCNRSTTPIMMVPCGGENTIIKTEPGVVGCNKNLLLRQCLEDTSFQQKCNFKPMDLPSSTLMGEADSVTSREIGPATSDNTSSHSNFELNQIEPMFSMAFAQIRSDIQNACTSLGISPDPLQWSGPDVRSWLTHTLSSLPIGTMMGDSTGSGNNSMALALRQFWNLDGRSLCLLTEEEFRLRDPVNGSEIFNHLELWKALQNKGCSTHLPDMKTEVSFPGPSNNVFDLEQLLLSPDVAHPSTSSTSSVSELTNLGKNVGNPSVAETNTFTTSPPAPSPPMEPATSPASSSFPSPVAPESMNTDDDDDEEEEEDEKKPGVNKCSKGSGVSKSGAHIHLWQFLKELLASPQQHGSCIRWLDQSRGVFKIEDSVRVARLWGLRKNRPAMNYDKLSRSIRQYYRKGIMKKTERSQRLVYQFCHPYGL